MCDPEAQHLGDHSRPQPGPPRGRRVLFASAHSIVNFSNGASVATLDLLQRLATLGFESHAFCTPKLDFHHEVCFEKIVADLREPYHITASACGIHRAQVLYIRRHRVPITVIRLESTRLANQRPDEVHAVLEFFGKFLDVNRPDVMITYGGDPISQGMIALAGRRGIPVAFSIHNFAYTNPRPFASVDRCIVPSEFARRHYRDRVGLECDVLPYPVNWERVRVETRDPRFVTFVNPALEKGAGPFVRIAREMARRRPDIPILVVESRGDRRTLAACGFDPAACGNVQIMTHTTDPRRFWGVTRFALMPSLWWENQPLVAIEAMINGIPVIGSDRGGIPEALGGCGFVLPLPERLTPVSTIVPEAEEVEPWVETIVRLWDDRELYEEQCARARNEAERWNHERLNPLYAEFFGSVRRQPGGPVLVRNEEGGASQIIGDRTSPHRNRLPGRRSARTVTQGLFQEPGPTGVGWVQPTEDRPRHFGGLHPPYKSEFVPSGTASWRPGSSHLRGGNGTETGPDGESDPDRDGAVALCSWCAAGTRLSSSGTCSPRRASGPNRGTRY